MATARLFKKQANEISSKWLSSANAFLPKDGIDICSVLMKKYSARNLELEDLLNSIEEICIAHPNLISTFLHLFYDRPMLDDSSSLNDDSLLENDVSSLHSTSNSLVSGQLSADLPPKVPTSEVEIARENIAPVVGHQELAKAPALIPLHQEKQSAQRFYGREGQIEKVAANHAGNLTADHALVKRDKPDFSSNSALKDTSVDLPAIIQAAPTTTRLPPIKDHFREPLSRVSAPLVSNLPPAITITSSPPSETQPAALAPVSTTQAEGLRPQAIPISEPATLNYRKPAKVDHHPYRKPILVPTTAVDPHYQYLSKQKYSAKNEKKRTAEEQQEINKKLQLASQLIANVLSERISPNGSKKKKAKKAAVSNLN